MRQILDDFGVEKIVVRQVRLIDDNRYSPSLDTFHDALNAGGTEVVRASFHDQTIDSDNFRFALKDFFCNEILACGIGLDDGVDQVLRYFVVVGQQLLGVLGQAVTTITEAGVVVVRANSRIKTDAIDDLASIETIASRVGVKFVKVGHAHGKIGVGEQLGGFGLGAAS